MGRVRLLEMRRVRDLIAYITVDLLYCALETRYHKLGDQVNRFRHIEHRPHRPIEPRTGPPCNNHYKCSGKLGEELSGSYLSSLSNAGASSGIPHAAKCPQQGDPTTTLVHYTYLSNDPTVHDHQCG
ncbi:hypothetical protein D5086_000969 [Populus alba]|uniref:Uncharacterized protein n=1 Tax=Populus alba TaxID=43335 RepID=A0ACC4CY30_POPAL